MLVFFRAFVDDIEHDVGCFWRRRRRRVLNFCREIRRKVKQVSALVVVVVFVVEVDKKMGRTRPRGEPKESILW